MSDSSVHAANKKNKRRAGAGTPEASQVAPNVFDTHGNELLGLHMQDARAQQEEEQGTSVLAAASAELDEEQEQEQELVEQAEQKGDQEDEGLAQAHVDAHGDAEQLKQALMDGSGTTILVRYMDEAQSELDMPPMNPDAQRAVVDQIRRQVDERALAGAQDMAEVDEVMRQALRENALRAREEIILLMMRLTSSPQDMEAIGSLPEKGDRAIQVVEYLAEFTAEIDDLHALAAYDHRDLMHDIPVISTEALEIKRYLSPLALHFGGFAPILWQMICNELDRTAHGGKVEEVAEGEQADTTGLSSALMVMVNDMRMARFLEG